MSSILGRVTFSFFGISESSKFAIEALTDSQRYELSPLGIESRCAAECPYDIDVHMQQPLEPQRVGLSARSATSRPLFEGRAQTYQGRKMTYCRVTSARL
jgi:NAD(P)-dependent dehydrogenase (short-subunit alcohol dehydrogenase family)